MTHPLWSPLRGKLRLAGLVSGSGNTLWKTLELQKQLEKSKEGSPFEVVAVLCLIALLTAVYMLRASGALTLLTRLLTPVLERLGIPPETAALLLVRPVSGSGALAVGSELMAAHGPDSYIGRCAAVMLGCTETTFYTIAVYFGAAGIRRTRYTIPAALTADLAGFMAAAWSGRLFFGT